MSLTSVLCKVLEGVARVLTCLHIAAFDVMSPIKDFLNEPLVTNPLGFSNEVIRSLGECMLVGVSCLDFRKNYDLVNHRFLSLRFRALGIDHWSEWTKFLMAGLSTSESKKLGWSLVDCPRAPCASHCCFHSSRITMTIMIIAIVLTMLPIFLGFREFGAEAQSTFKTQDQIFAAVCRY